MRRARHPWPSNDVARRHEPIRHGKQTVPLACRRREAHDRCLPSRLRYVACRLTGFRRLLDNDEPRLLLDRFQTEAAVRSGARQNYAYRARAVVVRQRMQQEIERQSCAMPGLRRDEVQRALGDREIGARRNDVQVAALMLMPSAACNTFIDVWSASSSTIMLSWFGSRCCTRMKAMPMKPSGRASSSFLQASSPPAEAPTATTRKLSASRAEDCETALGCPPACGRLPAARTRTNCRHFGLFSDGGRPLNFLFLC